jgi:methylamine dehydrogenase accessory protein MauD
VGVVVMATAVLVLRVVLAAVFLTAGAAKLLDLAGSRRAVQDFGVPERAAGIVGTVLPLVEVATGVALIFQPSARWGAVAALVLLLAFVAGIGRALARGEQPDCHCFGQLHSAPTSRITLARNAILAALALVILAYGSGPAVDTWVGARSAAVLVAIGAGVAAIAAAAYALTLRAENKRLEGDLRLARGQAAHAQGVAIGFDAPHFALPDLHGEQVGLPELLARGRPVLLMFMSPFCGPCASMLPRVQQWQHTLSERLTLALISQGTREQNETFAEHGIEDVLIQEEFEVAQQFGVSATPSAVFISREGKVASTVGETEYGIEPLVRLALRDGVTPAMQGQVA